MNTYVFIPEAVVPLRAEPREGSEMVSQLLFGDFGEVLDEVPGWKKLGRLMDGYIGWASANMLMPITEKQAALATARRTYVQTHGTFIEQPDSAKLLLPIGASVPGGGATFQIGDLRWNLPDGLHTSRSTEDIVDCAMSFLGTPYLWGGRSSFGIDCSGLTQSVFAMCGLSILRDSGAQATLGEVCAWDERKTGDLAFFSKPDKSNISHVGILIDQTETLHASGRVRLDKYDKEGIILPTGDLSHRLIQINRYF